MTPAKFVFTVSRTASKPLSSTRLAGEHSRTLRFAFSRPGFVTFRMPHDLAVETGASSPLDFRDAFARTWGFSTGKVAGTDADQTARAFWKTVLEAYGADPVRAGPRICTSGRARSRAAGRCGVRGCAGRR